MFLIELCYTYPYAQMEIDVVRKTLPSLKATAYKDFLELLQSFGAYDENMHNLTELTYVLNGNIWNFYSLDQPKKVRGRKRHVLFLNEGNELDLESFRQLAFRTTHKIIIDYNPSDPEHWVYELDKRKDCTNIVTTYKDNPHLTPGQVYDIEILRETDPDYWEVFGLGQIGAGLKGRVYTHWQKCDVLPDEYPSFYGCDFGYNDPLVLVEVKMNVKQKIIWVKQLLYASGKTTDDLEDFIKGNKIKGTIWADSAAAETIKRLQKRGINIQGTKKGKDSIVNGINMLKGYTVYYTVESHDIHKEQLHYKWKLDVNEKPMDEPIDAYNHAMDAIRYAVTSRVEAKSRMTAGAY